MVKILKYLMVFMVCALGGTIHAQVQHLRLANGEKVINGNRLISVKSEVGKQLYQPERVFFKREITTNAEMTEPEWKEAQVVAPFLNAAGKLDKTTVRVLYDEKNIYLFWEIDQPDGITSQVLNNDSIITKDDYIQIDLKPLLPDSIHEGRNYSYSIAVNPDGVVWDSYFDPYLGGYYYSSWNSQAKIATKKHINSWQVEMTIPFEGLDVASDPGWKWNLEFHHASIMDGKTDISSSGTGITVEQKIMVRQPGLVAYYWARPEFMPEIKQNIGNLNKKETIATQLKSLPKINNLEDGKIWENTKVLDINYTDKMGKYLADKNAMARVGIFENIMCFNLQGNGAKIQTGKDTSNVNVTGMGAQMAGVNGVFVDQSLFENESFILILQPRDLNADKIHQDYYLIIINNHGEIRGIHYDQFGTPYTTWTPKADVDIYNTASGWGAEVNLDLESLDIPVDYSKTWGFNIFRNRLVNKKEFELQAWESTANDFMNPQKLGEISGINLNGLSVVRSNFERKIKKADSMILKYGRGDQRLVKSLTEKIRSSGLETLAQIRNANLNFQQINNILGTMAAASRNLSEPHPKRHGFPLMDVQFIGDHGWAVGAMGTVLRTADGGKKWDNISIKSDADLYRVKFINEKEGWAVGGSMRMGETNESMRHDQRGGYAYVYHTKDGGKTWDCQFAENGRLLFGLDFVNKNIGYACGERGFLLKTLDGGKHWTSLPTTGTLNWLYGMAFKNEKIGFAVGLNETVIKTINGGNSWVKLDVPADRFYGFRSIYRDINFSGNTGCIVGQNGCILISHNGGETWEPSATYFRNDVRELLDLRSVQFVTPQLGYAVGELGTEIMMTEDGGRNWNYRSTGNTEWLRAVWASPSGKLIAVGEREKILASQDRGLSWKKLNGDDTKMDILVMMAHGDDAAINLNSFLAYYAINQGKKIMNVSTVSNLHSSEYEETYNLEMDRNARMMGVGTTSNFNQFETGNNGANYYHYNQRLWEGEDNIVRHMVAVIRAYRPDIVITHDGVFGDYDKSEHKVSGRAGLLAFETAGGPIDLWPELTRLGLKPWLPKKLYNLAGNKHPAQSYPATIDLNWIADQPLKGTTITCKEYGNYVIRVFQSQGVYHHTGDTELSLIRSNVPVIANEKSVFDGLSH
jgi:photosystem II stability/assembly factor-like uncharacterized protein